MTFFKERDYDGVAKFSFTVDEANKGQNLIDLGDIYLEIPKKKEPKKYLIYNKKSKKTLSQEVQNVLKTIYFENNSYGIRAKEEEKLDKLALILNKYKKLKIDVIGHTDSKGSKEYNMELSHKRAKSVKEYLLTKGVDSQQLNTLGMGVKEAKFSNQVVFQVR